MEGPVTSGRPSPQPGYEYHNNKNNGINRTQSQAAADSTTPTDPDELWAMLSVNSGDTGSMVFPISPAANSTGTASSWAFIEPGGVGGHFGGSTSGMDLSSSIPAALSPLNLDYDAHPSPSSYTSASYPEQQAIRSSPVASFGVGSSAHHHHFGGSPLSGQLDLSDGTQFTFSDLGSGGPDGHQNFFSATDGALLFDQHFDAAAANDFNNLFFESFIPTTTTAGGAATEHTFIPVTTSGAEQTTTFIPVTTAGTAQQQSLSIHDFGFDFPPQQQQHQQPQSILSPSSDTTSSSYQWIEDANLGASTSLNIAIETQRHQQQQQQQQQRLEHHLYGPGGAPSPPEQQQREQWQPSPPPLPSKPTSSSSPTSATKQQLPVHIKRESGQSGSGSGANKHRKSGSTVSSSSSIATTHINNNTSTTSSSTTSTTATKPINIPKVSKGRVQKRKSSPTTTYASGSGNSSANSSLNSNKFFIVTPQTVNAHAKNKDANPYECFEAFRTSQRGRKGPLADDTKESALEVRRRGACFCCQARKVGCDKERPCRACKKLALRVPQVMCWRFPDFEIPLFPHFVRLHFGKGELERMLSTCVKSFTVTRGVGGAGEAVEVEQPVQVELWLGGRFETAKMRLNAKFFTPRPNDAEFDIMHFWAMEPKKPGAGSGKLKLRKWESAHIGLDLGSMRRQQDEMRQTLRRFINDAMADPKYAWICAGWVSHTTVPYKVLRLVHAYAEQTGDPLVRSALTIFTIQYILTCHLTLTPECIAALEPYNLLPAYSYTLGGAQAPTTMARLLNRQIKSVLDEIARAETTNLFDGFAKALKSKTRKEWAPCVAAFLVMCLYMEQLQAAHDRLVTTNREIAWREGKKPDYEREEALRANFALEAQPFKQFAFMFHQIYQSYAYAEGGGSSSGGGSNSDANKAFNPIMAEHQIAELSEPAQVMTRGLSEMVIETETCEFRRLPLYLMPRCIYQQRKMC